MPAVFSGYYQGYKLTPVLGGQSDQFPWIRSGPSQNEVAIDFPNPYSNLGVESVLKAKTCASKPSRMELWVSPGSFVNHKIKMVSMGAFHLEILHVQWNSTLRLHRPDPSHCALGYCSCKQDTKERYWGQQFCQMERNISVRLTEMTRPVKEDYLQSWSRILRSD